MQRPDIAEHLPIKPLRLILGVIACIGIAATLFTLLFGFTTIPANSVGVKTRFGAYHEIVNPGLAYAIPYIDEIYVVPTQRLQKLAVRFFYPGRDEHVPGRSAAGGNRDDDHGRSEHRARAVGGAISDHRSKNVFVWSARAGENLARSFRKRDAGSHRRPDRG